MYTFITIMNWLTLTVAVGLIIVSMRDYRRQRSHERSATFGLIAMIVITSILIIATITTALIPTKMSITRLIFFAAMSVNLISIWTSPVSQETRKRLRPFLAVSTVLLTVGFIGLAVIALTGR